MIPTSVGPHLRRVVSAERSRDREIEARASFGTTLAR